VVDIVEAGQAGTAGVADLMWSVPVGPVNRFRKTRFCAIGNGVMMASPWAIDAGARTDSFPMLPQGLSWNLGLKMQHIPRCGQKARKCWRL
jgi:hypothetical protein